MENSISTEDQSKRKFETETLVFDLKTHCAGLALNIWLRVRCWIWLFWNASTSLSVLIFRSLNEVVRWQFTGRISGGLLWHTLQKSFSFTVLSRPQSSLLPLHPFLPQPHVILPLNFPLSCMDTALPSVYIGELLQHVNPLVVYTVCGGDCQVSSFQHVCVGCNTGQNTTVHVLLIYLI